MLKVEITADIGNVIAYNKETPTPKTFVCTISTYRKYTKDRIAGLDSQYFTVTKYASSVGEIL